MIILKTGYNLVTYTGKAQLVSAALTSIASYLQSGTITYRNNTTDAFEVPASDSLMVPYGCYWVRVTQDCTWTYGDEEVAPTSVQLYGGRVNYVPYCGEEKPLADALAIILDDIDGTVAYYNNETKSYEISASRTSGVWAISGTAVPNRVYVIPMIQDRVWSFGPSASGTVTLQPGESKSVAFEAVPTVAKTYQVSVDVLTGSFRAVAPAPVVPPLNTIVSVSGILTLVGFDTMRMIGQLSIATDMAIDTSGKDWGGALGTIEVFSNWPFAFEAGPGYAIPIPLIYAGRRVLATGVARTPFTLPDVVLWTASRVTYYPDYPSSAYQFTLIKGTIAGKGVWTVTGNVPSFAIVAAFWEGTYHHAYLDQRVTGPISNWQYPVCLGLSTMCWCHPDPNASFVCQYQRELEINGWVLVGYS